MSPTEFEVLSVGSDGQHALVLRGELDVSGAQQLRDAVTAACEASPRELVLDLSQLTFIDSTGVRTILAAAEECQRLDRELRVMPGPRNVQIVFELTGVLEQLPFEGAAAYKPAREAILPNLFRTQPSEPAT